MMHSLPSFTRKDFCNVNLASFRNLGLDNHLTRLAVSAESSVSQVATLILTNKIMHKINAFYNSIISTMLLTRGLRFDHITPVLKDLRWFLIDILDETAVLVCKYVQGTPPECRPQQ